MRLNKLSNQYIRVNEPLSNFNAKSCLTMYSPQNVRSGPMTPSRYEKHQASGQQEDESNSQIGNSSQKGRRRSRYKLRSSSSKIKFDEILQKNEQQNGDMTGSFREAQHAAGKSSFVEEGNFGDMFNQVAADRMLSGETMQKEFEQYKQEPMLLANDYVDENVDEADGGELPTNEEFQSAESFMRKGNRNLVAQSHQDQLLQMQHIQNINYEENVIEEEYDDSQEDDQQEEEDEANISVDDEPGCLPVAEDNASLEIKMNYPNNRPLSLISAQAMSPNAMDLLSDRTADRNVFTNRAHTYFEDEEASPEHENLEEDSEELRPLSEATRRKQSFQAFRNHGMREGDVMPVSGTSSHEAMRMEGPRFIRELSVEQVRTNLVSRYHSNIDNNTLISANQAVVKVSELLTPKIVSRSSGGLNRTNMLQRHHMMHVDKFNQDGQVKQALDDVEARLPENLHTASDAELEIAEPNQLGQEAGLFSPRAYLRQTPIDIEVQQQSISPNVMAPVDGSSEEGYDLEPEQHTTNNKIKSGYGSIARQNVNSLMKNYYSSDTASRKSPFVKFQTTGLKPESRVTENRILEPIKFRYKLVDHHTHNKYQPTVDFNQGERRALADYTAADVDRVYTNDHDSSHASPPQRHSNLNNTADKNDRTILEEEMLDSSMLPLQMPQGGARMSPPPEQRVDQVEHRNSHDDNYHRNEFKLFRDVENGLEDHEMSPQSLQPELPNAYMHPAEQKNEEHHMSSFEQLHQISLEPRSENNNMPLQMQQNSSIDQTNAIISEAPMCTNPDLVVENEQGSTDHIQDDLQKGDVSMSIPINNKTESNAEIVELDLERPSSSADGVSKRKRKHEVVSRAFFRGEESGSDHLSVTPPGEELTGVAIGNSPYVEKQSSDKKLVMMPTDVATGWGRKLHRGKDNKYNWQNDRTELSQHGWRSDRARKARKSASDSLKRVQIVPSSPAILRNDTRSNGRSDKSRSSNRDYSSQSRKLQNVLMMPLSGQKTTDSAQKAAASLVTFQNNNFLQQPPQIIVNFSDSKTPKKHLPKAEARKVSKEKERGGWSPHFTKLGGAAFLSKKSIYDPKLMSGSGQRKSAGKSFASPTKSSAGKKVPLTTRVRSRLGLQRSNETGSILNKPTIVNLTHSESVGRVRRPRTVRSANNNRSVPGKKKASVQQALQETRNEDSADLKYGTGSLDLKVQVSETAVGQSHIAANQFYLQDLNVGTGLLGSPSNEYNGEVSAEVREQQVINAIRELIADENRNDTYEDVDRHRQMRRQPNVTCPAGDASDVLSGVTSARERRSKAARKSRAAERREHMERLMRPLCYKEGQALRTARDNARASRVASRTGSISRSPKKDNQTPDTATRQRVERRYGIRNSGSFSSNKMALLQLKPVLQSKVAQKQLGSIVQIQLNLASGAPTNSRQTLSPTQTSLPIDIVRADSKCCCSRRSTSRKRARQLSRSSSPGVKQSLSPPQPLTSEFMSIQDKYDVEAQQSRVRPRTSNAFSNNKYKRTPQQDSASPVARSRSLRETIKNLPAANSQKMREKRLYSQMQNQYRQRQVAFLQQNKHQLNASALEPVRNSDKSKVGTGPSMLHQRRTSPAGEVSQPQRLNY